ncbi:MAG: Ig-like domain-containing protein [Candidatus Aminicenantes bacterium]
MTAKVDFGRIPLYFIPNKGQVDPKALFYAKTQNYTLWLIKDGLIFDHTIGEGIENPWAYMNPKSDLETMRLKRDLSRLHFVGCNTDTEVVPTKMCEYRVNYFKGKNPGNWVNNIPTSQGVLYKNLYDQMDLKVYGNGTRLEYDWIVRPGGNPDEIKMEFNSTKSCALNEEGDLLVITETQKIVHKKPQAYQTIGEEKKEVAASLFEISKNRFGFVIDDNDPGCTLVIDPIVLVYSTFLGGKAKEYGFAIAVDSAGYAYVIGETTSSSFPTTPGGEEDSFLIKLDASGTSLLYSNYLGGESIDSGEGIAVDGEGSVYIAGTTYSENFSTKNAYEDTYIGGLTDCFVAKFEDSEDTIPAEISITNPNEGDVVSRSVSVEAQAFDNHYVLTVDFYIDNVLISTDSTKPYGFSWETLHYNNGPHRISTVAFDTTGNSSNDAVNVMVNDLKTNPWWDIPRKPEQRKIPDPLLFLAGIFL